MSLRRTLSILTAALAVAATLAPTSASAGLGDPEFERPVVGECRAITYKEVFAQSNSTAPIPCSESHTANTFAAPLLPPELTWDSSDAAIGKAVSKKCGSAYFPFLGGTDVTRAQTAYSYAWFSPTQAQRDAGARWFRCDLILYRGTKLSPLPYDTAPVVPDPITNKVRRCLKATTFYTTTCDDTHAWKATHAFKLRKGDYPTARQMSKFAINGCKGHVKAGTFRYDPPSKGDWKAGYRVMVCFSKTSN
jgi:Septum formation